MRLFRERFASVLWPCANEDFYGRAARGVVSHPDLSCRFTRKSLPEEKKMSTTDTNAHRKE